MTFEEYSEKYLQALTGEARRLVQMGWNGHAEFGGDQAPEATKMIKGNVALAGDITDDEETTFHRALLIQFATGEDMNAAIRAGQCRFTVFGGEV